MSGWQTAEHALAYLQRADRIRGAGAIFFAAGTLGAWKRFVRERASTS